MKKQFPPNKLKELDIKSASNFISLIKDSRESKFTLVLGAGVSASAGIPQWKELLRKMCSCFFSHWEPVDNPPKNLSIAFVDDFLWDDESVEFANKFSEDDLLLAAQQIKNCIRDLDWIYLLRHCLYDEIQNTPQTSKLIESIAELCVNNTDKIKAIINYNYDDLFELTLKTKGVRYNHVGSDKKYNNKIDSIPIYHPHGILPIIGDIKSNIIIAEDDYHKETMEPYSKSNLVQIHCLCNSTCVFFGTSMRDPNLRRLLRISSSISPNKHYVFLIQSSNRDKYYIMYDSLFDNDLIKLGVKTIRYEKQLDLNDIYLKLPELINILDKSLTNKGIVWD